MAGWMGTEWSIYQACLWLCVYSSCMCFSLFSHAVVLDAYPNTATVKQGTTVVLVCRVVGVPPTSVVSYQWTCPEGSCDAGAVDPEWAVKVQQGNILVVNVRNDNDNGCYTCTILEGSTILEGGSQQQVGKASYALSVASEYVVAPSVIICLQYCNIELK